MKHNPQAGGISFYIDGYKILMKHNPQAGGISFYIERRVHILQMDGNQIRIHHGKHNINDQTRHYIGLDRSKRFLLK
jgi:hypothetical protein